jgi:hypothetical protein
MTAKRLPEWCRTEFRVGMRVSDMSRPFAGNAGVITQKHGFRLRIKWDNGFESSRHRSELRIVS